jgi:hypothetical protein
MTLSIVIGNEHVIHSQDLDRFTQLESDFSTASKDRWSLILPELCRAAKTAPNKSRCQRNFWRNGMSSITAL